MRHHRRTALVAVAAGLVLSLSMSTPGAHATSSDGPARVTVADQADGMTGQQLIAQAVIGFYQADASAPPGPCAYVGRTGKILLAGDHFTVCSVPQGYPVIYFFGGSCDSVTPPISITAREQRRCALASNKAFIAAMHLSVDGGHSVKISTDRFLTCTGQKSVQIPPDNFFGVPGGPATFVACVYAAFVDHLSLGLHTTVLDVDFVDGGHDSLERTVNVVP